MSFKSFFQFLNRAWRKNKPINKKPPQNRFARPLVEMLERRDLMTVPTILASGVLPVDGSSVSTSTPVIQVQFSESMTNSVLTPSSYVLLSSSGNSIPVDLVNFVSLGAPPVNSAVQLQYNGGAGLVVNNYSLFVRGDRMVNVDEGLAWRNRAN